jgi:hypothetical protein
MNCEISFTVEIHGRELPPISFNDATPFEGVSITHLDNKKGEYRITISMKEVNSYEDAYTHAELTIETLLSALAYYLRCFVGELRFDVARTVEGKNTTIYPSPMSIGTAHHGSFQISADSILQLLRRTSDCPYFTMFRHAMQIRDELGKFMGLYNVLLSVRGDKQKKVDSFILKRDPNTPVSRSPCNTMETVFTKLRNQVGHVRHGVTLLETRREIAQNLLALQSHVVAAIEAKLANTTSVQGQK